MYMTLFVGGIQLNICVSTQCYQHSYCSPLDSSRWCYVVNLNKVMW